MAKKKIDNIPEDPMANPNPPKKRGRKPKDQVAIVPEANETTNETTVAEEKPVDIPIPATDGRDSSGRFTKGHAKTGGIQAGQKHKVSLRVQNSVLNMVANEVESDRFQSGLRELRIDDPKGYYQVLAALMKFCAPTLQSQSLEISSKDENKTIDDMLNELMNQK